MKWIGNRQSDNVEDRRGMSGGKLAAGGGVIAIVFFLIKAFFPEAAPFVDTIQQSQQGQQSEPTEQRALTPEEIELNYQTFQEDLKKAGLELLIVCSNRFLQYSILNFQS